VTWGIDQQGKRSEEEGNGHRWRNSFRKPWQEICKPFWQATGSFQDGTRGWGGTC
jgi:hypothetical protein